MGVENLEDYNVDFFVMFETWQATKEYLAHRRVGAGESTELAPVEVAQFLGWTF